MPGGAPWPRVSIVTPSYNQAQFIETTIRSVFLQGYPNLEYIVIDGGSTDGSVEIIRRYEPWLAYWVSERDRGQSHAINKGFAKATGDIFAWLNSDDSYLSGVMLQAVYSLSERQSDIVHAGCRLINPQGDLIETMDSIDPITSHRLLMAWEQRWPFPAQPTVFLRRQVLERVGMLNEELHYLMDVELWLRALQKGFTFSFVNKLWANYIIHPQSKTGKGKLPFNRELYRIGCEYGSSLDWFSRLVFRFAGLRIMNSRWYLERAFAGFGEADWPMVRRHIARAISSNPLCLLNRGVLSLCVQAYGEHITSDTTVSL